MLFKRKQVQEQAYSELLTLLPSQRRLAEHVSVNMVVCWITGMTSACGLVRAEEVNTGCVQAVPS